MKNPEQIFDEAIKAKGLDIISVKDADLYEAGLYAIKQALIIDDVVNRRELLLDYADYSERDKTSRTTDECVDNYLDSIK